MSFTRLEQMCFPDGCFVTRQNCIMAIMQYYFVMGSVPAITRLVLNVMRLPQQFVLLNIVMMGTLMILVGDTMFAE